MSRKTERRGRTAAAPVTIRATLAPAVWWTLAVAVVALLVYLPALANGFIWDDPKVLEQLRAIHGLRDILVPPDVIPKYYYRPLIFLSFLFDRALGGETPFWFHFSVVAMHTINAVLVCWLALRLLGPTPACALASLVFAVHPIHVESVSWIAGRSDVFSATFLLLAAIGLTYSRLAWATWAAAGAYALALLCKEAALGALPVLVAIDLVLGRKARWRIDTALALTTVAYLLLRRAALGAAVTGFATTASPDQIVRDLLAAVGFYVGKLILPINLSAYVAEVPGGWLPPLAGLAVVGAAVTTAFVAWSRGERTVSFAFAWFFCTLAPSLAVIVRYSAQAPVADRYLYVPSIAASLLLARVLAWIFAHRPRLRPAAVATVLAVSALFAVLSAARNRVWADEALFWQDVAAKSPGYALGHRELALIYMDRNRLDDAEAALKRALQAKSDRDGRVMTLNNAGTLYLRQGRLDEAERAFEEGLELYPHPFLSYGLGRVAMTRAQQAQARGDQSEVKRQVGIARDHLRQSLAADPTSAKAHVLLGQVLYALQQPAEAREHLQRALQLGARGKIAQVARQYLEMLGS